MEHELSAFYFPFAKRFEFHRRTGFDLPSIYAMMSSSSLQLVEASNAIPDLKFLGLGQILAVEMTNTIKQLSCRSTRLNA
jgi:hypothetical protein